MSLFMFERNRALLSVIRRVTRRSIARTVLTAMAVVMLGFGPGLLGAAAATNHAVKFENRSSETIWLVVMEYDPSKCITDYWYVHGWWEILPGQSQTIYTEGSSLWYHGRGTDGGKWGDWLGVYVIDERFERCRPNDGDGSNPGSGYYLVEMREIYLAPYDDYTMRLNG